MALFCQLSLIILKKGSYSQQLFAQGFVVFAPEFNSQPIDEVQSSF